MVEKFLRETSESLVMVLQLIEIHRNERRTVRLGPSNRFDNVSTEVERKWIRVCWRFLSNKSHARLLFNKSREETCLVRNRSAINVEYLDHKISKYRRWIRSVFYGIYCKHASTKALCWSRIPRSLMMLMNAVLRFSLWLRENTRTTFAIEIKNKRIQSNGRRSLTLFFFACNLNMNTVTIGLSVGSRSRIFLKALWPRIIVYAKSIVNSDRPSSVLITSCHDQFVLHQWTSMALCVHLILDVDFRILWTK